MKRLSLIGPLAACVCFNLATPLLAADPLAGGSDDKSAAPTKPAQECLNDIRGFRSQMERDGYRLDAPGYGYDYYGHPLGEHRIARDPLLTLRPGHEVRLLLLSAYTLARQGQQRHCEDVLATTRALYGTYLKNLQSPARPVVDSHTWRQYEIAAAQPVIIDRPYYGSDMLIGTEVRDAKGEALGDVVDLEIIPDTAVIAYVLIARGGVFGFDEIYVPVPWQAFKMTPNGKLLVLETTTSALEAAPQMTEDQFIDAGQFERLRGKVDIYWKANLANPK